jgi:hypothetical protein
MENYKHTQIGYLLMIALGAGVLMAGYLVVRTRFNPATLVILMFLLACWAVISTLTVEVDDQTLRLQFGLGMLRKIFLLRQVESYQVVENPWYYGWGIHFFGKGWLYNVSGTQAVELKMKNGHLVRIGTDDTAGLIQSIKARLPQR